MSIHGGDSRVPTASRVNASFDSIHAADGRRPDRRIPSRMGWGILGGRPIGPLLFAGAISVACAAPLSAGDAQKPVDQIIKDVVVDSGRTIAKATKSVIQDIEAATPQSKPGKTKRAKTAKAKPSAESVDKRAGAEPGAKSAEPAEAATQSAPKDKGAAPAPAADAAAEKKPPPSFPKTVDEAKAEAEGAKKPPPAWTEQEIAEAKARCTAILKRISAVAIPEPPLREGNCGTPAPIELVSIGHAPEVAISPPAIMTCELAEALETWMKTDVQPLARKHLGAEVVRIENMSSYSCRAAYGRAGNKLSEHGLANALDIRGFVTAQAKTAYVLENWGEPQREINARIAAAKAAAEKADAERLAAEKAGQDNLKTDKNAPSATPPVATATANSGAPAGGIARGAIVDGLPKVTVTLPGAATPSAPAPSLSITEPSHLGAAKPHLAFDLKSGGKTAAPKSLVTKTAGVQVIVAIPAKSEPPDAKGEFLRQAHAAACRIFGTTLGPEANAAHRNHFHVDMAKRKSATTKICD